MDEGLDRARLERFLGEIVDRLEGDWLLLGGALVALWLDPDRCTEDIDLVSMGERPSDRYQLLGIAEELGLPFEALNSAADFLVRKIPDWRQQTEPMTRGRSARIFRPTPTLFLLLKLRRLSEQDLQDCLHLLRLVGEEGLDLDRDRVLRALDDLDHVEEPALRERRGQLRREVSKRD